MPSVKSNLQNELKIMLTQSVNYANYANLSIAQKQQLLNALNYYLTAYGAKDYQLADSIVSVNYRPQSDLWQIKYLSKNNSIVKHETMYDSELANCLTQTKDIPVFDAEEELLETVSALKEEFAGVSFVFSGQKAIIIFGGLALTFITRHNQLIFCTRTWDCGNSWVTDNVDRTYRTHSQIQKLKAQLRSDFWFELEVLEVA